MGNASQCAEFHPQEWNDTDPLPRRFTPHTATDLEARTLANNGNRNITVEHIFQIINAYYVTVTVSNQVSNCSYTWRTGVTKGPCYWPIVDLKEPNKCTAPNKPKKCKDGVKMVLRSKILLVHSKIQFNCTSTNRANFIWQIYKVIRCIDIIIKLLIIVFLYNVKGRIWYCDHLRFALRSNLLLEYFR